VSLCVQHETQGRLTLLEEASRRSGLADGGDGEEMERFCRLTSARLKEIQEVLSHPRDQHPGHGKRLSRIAPQTL
jgi:hypothetical protein